MRDVVGKTAFVTGGASGIGLAMAHVFLDAGMNVVIADASAAHLDDAARDLAGEAALLCLLLDVTDRDAWVKAADAAEARFGRLHILCNNAGIGTATPISEPRYDAWDRVLAVNLGGVVNGIVTMLPRLRRHGEGGHIVNTASMAAILPLGDSGGIYTASKFAVRGLSDSLRLALVPDRIGVSCLFPGLTRTRILDDRRRAAEAAGGADPATAAFIAAQDSAMDPMDLARAVLDAVRANDAYIIGHHEFVDQIEDAHAELIAAIRHDLPMDPARAAFEDRRHRDLRRIRDAMKPW